jgi:hypothetical protein
VIGQVGLGRKNGMRGRDWVERQLDCDGTGGKGRMGERGSVALG